MNKRNYDFAGYVTRNDIQCSDGVTIRHGAFDKSDGTTVPLVWQHDYNSVTNVLGHMILHTVDDGVYGEGYLNDSDTANHAKTMIEHGDLKSMSIGARGIRKDEMNNVLHGEIYEVSLVLKGANPGATIEHVMTHSAYGINEIEDQVTIYSGEEATLIHADNEEEETVLQMNNDNLTVGDVINNFSPEEDQAVQTLLTEGEDALTDEQIDLLNNFSDEEAAVVGILAEAMIEDEDEDEDDSITVYEDEETGQLYAEDGTPIEIDEDGNVFDVSEEVGVDEDVDDDSDSYDDESEDAGETVTQSMMYEGEDTLKHNAFNQNQNNYAADSNKEFANTILQSAIKGRAQSLAQTFLYHNVLSNNEEVLQHGLLNIDLLFPQPAQQRGIQLHNPMALNVDKVMGMFGKSPMSRIKNLFADISQEEARARGYIKGNQKLESIEAVFYRETTPGTIYRKTRFDRDDIIDIQDNGIDIIAFVQQVQQAKLQEEIVRAAFMGDGRPAYIDGGRNPEHIDELHVRPILKDDPLFVIREKTANFETLIDTAMMTLPAYQGTGTPKLFINQFTLAKLKTLKDANGRYLYGTNADMNNVANDATIAAYFGCDEVVTLRFLPEDQLVIGNLNDYVFGMSKNGQIATFDQFDIDFNQHKYLIECRLSGAIQVPKSFIHITITDTSAMGSHPDVMKFETNGVKTHPSFTTNTVTDEKPGARYASSEAAGYTTPTSTSTSTSSTSTSTSNSAG